MTNYEYILKNCRVKKKRNQIIEEFNIFCRNQKGCEGCPFESYCTSFSISQMYDWLNKEYNGCEWITADDLK